MLLDEKFLSNIKKYVVIYNCSKVIMNHNIFREIIHLLYASQVTVLERDDKNKNERDRYKSYIV